MILGMMFLFVVRFVSVTDRFLAELAPVSKGQVPKDLDMKYENLVNSIRHIQIKVRLVTITLHLCSEPTLFRCTPRKHLRKEQSLWSRFRKLSCKPTDSG